MPFDTQQQSYRALREILALQIQPTLIWSGAGMSQPAGLPSWPALRSKLIDQANIQITHLEGNEAKRVQGLVQAAENTTNLWEAFGYLKKAFQPTSFAQAIKEELGKASTLAPPRIYERFWRLGVRGFLNLNLDRFASKGFAETQSKQNLAEFQGVDARYQADILRGGTPFVANLHGILDVEPSWVFTTEDFDSLMRAPAFKEFINSCFLTCTILFVGVSADDRGAGGHLARLRDAGLSLRGHYWMTNRADADTRTWAEANGISQIYYSAPKGDHAELGEAITDLERYVPSDAPVEPVVPTTRRERNLTTPPPEEVERLTAEEIRQILNKEAVRILDSGDSTRLTRYEEFCEKYSEAIHRAWSVGVKPGRNKFFEYDLNSALAGGAFGQVYRAVDKTGNDVAIKILHGNIKDEPDMLQGFRRGVKAMQILSDRGVSGMVPYIARWEIPASTVMEYVNGANLEQAIEWKYIVSWEDILKVSSDLISIVRSAHRVPEHVLHRDIRPANIMLKDTGKGDQSWEVVVLDFDLSWHKGAADVSIDLRKTANGYMAPEQTDSSRKHSSRNALVDSFGIGMTLFYLASHTHPEFGQQRHADWRDILKSKIAQKKCAEWVSLPRRFARLIEWTTKDEQPARWDLTRMQGEVDRLLDSVRSRSSKSCELITEEIAARCPDMAGYYEWDNDKTTATLVLRSGFTVVLQADEARQLIVIVVDWSNAGDKQFENVRRYIGNATEKSCAALRGGGWGIASQDKNVTASSSRVRGTVQLSKVKTEEAIEKAAKSIATAIQALRLT